MSIWGRAKAEAKVLQAKVKEQQRKQQSRAATEHLAREAEEFARKKAYREEGIKQATIRGRREARERAARPGGGRALDILGGIGAGTDRAQSPLMGPSLLLGSPPPRRTQKRTHKRTTSRQPARRIGDL